MFYAVYIHNFKMEKRLTRQYYSPNGYWKGFGAIRKLAQAAKVSENVAKRWLFKQALWEIYLPAPKRIPRPKFGVPTPNKVHQAGGPSFYAARQTAPRAQSFQIRAHRCRRGQPLQRGRTLDFEKF